MNIDMNVHIDINKHNNGRISVSLGIRISVSIHIHVRKHLLITSSLICLLMCQMSPIKLVDFITKERH